MNTISFFLVLTSVFTHAYWNYLLKSSGNKHIFLGLTKLAEVFIFAIPAIYFLLITGVLIEFWLIIFVAAGIKFLNNVFLSNAYKYGDLSLTYPLSRSSIIFLPIIAFYFIDERINRLGVLAIIMVIVGTLVMHMNSFNRNSMKSMMKNIKNKGSLYAMLAALSTAGCTLWDKISISKIEPFLYFYMYTFIVSILYNSTNLILFKKEEFKNEWKVNRIKILKVAFFIGFNNVLILTALTMSKVTYVGGLRQLSIVVGAFFGYKLLGENISKPKKVGILILFIGGCLIYLAE